MFITEKVAVVDLTGTLGGVAGTVMEVSYGCLSVRTGGAEREGELLDEEGSVQKVDPSSSTPPHRKARLLVLLPRS